MDGGLTVTLISVAMFVGCFLLGFTPLLFRLSEKSLQLVCILGAGLLCGTALAIAIPEGVSLLQESSPPCPHYLSLIGVNITATVGLVIHAAADGFALGAAAATGQVTVQVVIFLAVILHKAPAAFGLVSFLMHSGLEKKHIQGHLLAFSAAAPVFTIATYFILQASQLTSTGVGMLFSAGTFLYVATVHILPEVSSSAAVQKTSDLQLEEGAEGHQQQPLGLTQSITLIIGVGLPVALALGLKDD
uniref:Zinc transporter ZIP9 n=1 Tax=Takifugu rubripes TaxID=31033 RepID=A0A3B5JZI2_TAKRU